MKYQPLSPDGITITCEGTAYKTRASARRALRAWARRYEPQSYYRDANWNKIPLADLLDACSIVAVEMNEGCLEVNGVERV